ncbi:MAG TPA: flagellar hook capping FlgD N-terminal domain-containing protein [Alphaproteobacteria bacterium]|nr:flagellar hook capping FlgD N-terminal domain-containing protein [Alphaproteobacteria bacterium]
MVTSVGNNGTTTNSNDVLQQNTEKALNQLNFQTFLQLITTQLKNQDPLRPQDQSQFLGQLAQFGSLQQQINTNDLLKELNSQKDLGQQSLATSYLGHAVLAPGDSFNKSSDGSVPFGYSLEGDAAEVSVQIYDSTGKVVRTLNPTDKASLTEGSHTLSWDGKDDLGNYVDNGTYKSVITAYDTKGIKVVSHQLTYGVALAVNTASNGDVSLELGDGRNVAFGDVSQVVVNTASN